MSCSAVATQTAPATASHTSAAAGFRSNAQLSPAAGLGAWKAEKP